jgi:hypothetical protein
MLKTKKLDPYSYNRGLREAAEYAVNGFLNTAEGDVDPDVPPDHRKLMEEFARLVVDQFLLHEDE